jgi:hypothetical protein
MTIYGILDSRYDAIEIKNIQTRMMINHCIQCFHEENVIKNKKKITQSSFITIQYYKMWVLFISPRSLNQ